MVKMVDKMMYSKNERYRCPICHVAYHDRDIMMACMRMDREVLNRYPPSVQRIEKYRAAKNHYKFDDCGSLEQEFGESELEKEAHDYAVAYRKAWERMDREDNERHAKEMAVREEKRMAKFMEDHVRWFNIEF